MGNFISLIIYMLVILIPTYITHYLFHNVNHKKYYWQNRLSVISIFISTIPIVVIGLRYYVGTDFASYQYLSVLSSENSFFDILFETSRFEPGFRLMLIVSKVFNIEGGRSIFLIASILTYFTAIYAIIKSDCFKSKTICIFIYLCLFLAPSCNIIRQCVSIAILMFSLRYIFNNQFYKFLFIVIIATMFHYYSIVFIVAYFMNPENAKKFKDKTINFLIILSPFFIYLVLLILQSIGISSSLITLKPFDVSWLTIFLKLPVIVLLLVYYYLAKEKVTNFEIVSIRLYLLNLVSIAIGFFSNWGFRLSYIFLIGEILLISNLVDNLKNKRQKFCITIMIIVYYIVYFIVEYYFVGLEGIFPYRIMA